MRQVLPLLLLLPAACASGGGGNGGGANPGPVRGAPDPAVLAGIFDAEQTRNPRHASLTSAVSSSDPRLRARAATAFGRILRPEGIEALLKLLRDSNALVQREAVFAAGLFGYEGGAVAGRERDLLEAVKPLLDHSEQSIRIRAVQAVGRLGNAETPSIAVPLLKDPVVGVRAEAVLALFRWRQIARMRDPNGKPPDLAADASAALRATAQDSSPEVRWRAAYAIWRLADPRGAHAVKGLLADKESVWSRVFALRALGAAKDEANGEAAAALQEDPEAIVRAEAVAALTAMKRNDLVRHSLAKDPSHHVRAVLAAALGDKPSRDAETLNDLWKQDESPQVRAAALLSLVRMDPRGGRSQIFTALASRHAALRKAGVDAAASLKKDGWTILDTVSNEKDPLLRSAAIEALAKVEGRPAFEAIRKGLEASDLAVRGTAVEALKERKEYWLDLALKCYENSADRAWVEVREGIVDAVATLPPDKCTAPLKEIATKDPANSVRAKAVAALKRLGVTDALPEPDEDFSASPYLGHEVPASPVLVLETSRGTIEIQLFPKEAPGHVASIVALAGKGFYDGLSWHRVVPGFVIQGGDPMGNGWGDAGWNLRAEIGPLPFERGTLGMPRSHGWDTGGCQLFLTHLPTPHLDGLYTAFGRVTEGLDVVDRIEMGDTIRRATVR